MTQSKRVLGVIAFAFVISAAIYGSFEEIGFDPAFPRHGDLGDFGTFYESGRAALRGDDPYGTYELTYFAESGPQSAARNLNPPFSVLVFEVPALLEPTIAARLWNIAATLAYLAAILLLHYAYPANRAPWRLIWAFGVSSFWGTLALGQIYTFLALLATGAWLFLARGRDREGGLLIGAIVALKPNFLIWPMLLALGGRRTSALFACVCAAALSALPFLQLGPSVYGRWFSLLTETRVSSAGTNGSILAFTDRIGLPGLVGLLVCAALLAAVGWWAWTSRPSASHLSAAALTVTLLVSPIAWTGYAVLLIPAFFAFIWDLPITLAAVAMLVPIGSVILPLASLSPAWQVAFGSSYLGIWLLVLFAVVRQMRSSASGTCCT